MTPERIGYEKKYNPRYYALKALIAKEKVKLQKIKEFEFLAQ